MTPEMQGAIDRIETDVHDMRAELRQHMIDELPLIEAVKMLGNPEEIRTRIAFINILIDRERNRAQLRKAVIEKTVIGAVWAVIIFVGVAAWHEIAELVKTYRAH